MHRLFVLIGFGAALLFADESSSYLFVTLRSDGETVTVVSADTVSGTPRPLRGEPETPYSFRIDGTGGALVTGAVAPPPPLQQGVSSPDGRFTPVILPFVEWSFRIPLPEGGELLRIFESSEPSSSSPPPGEKGSPRRVSSEKEVAVWNLNSGGK